MKPPEMKAPEMMDRAPFDCDDQLAAIARGLLSCTWPRAHWTHDCHWAAALWLIAHEGLPAMQARMPGIIRRYNAAVGGTNSDTEGYHETITQASLLVAADALAKAPPDTPLNRTCNALITGPHGRADWIEAYWSPARLFTPEARRTWAAPDRAPFPLGAPPA